MHRSPIRIIIMGLLATALISCTTTGGTGENTPPSGDIPTATGIKKYDGEKMLKLTFRITDTHVETIHSVEAPNSINRRDPHRQSDTYFSVVDGNGQVVFKRGIRIESEIRAEFTDSEGNLTRVPGPAAEPIVSISVPLISGATTVRVLRKKGGYTAATKDASGDEDAQLIGEVQL